MKKTTNRKDDIYQKIEKIFSLSKRTYNRVLTTEEKELLEADAFGYLLRLYHYGTIDNLKLEKLIYCCVYIASARDEPLSLEKTKPLVNMLLFYDNALYYTKELLPLLNSLEEEITPESVN